MPGTYGKQAQIKSQVSHGGCAFRKYGMTYRNPDALNSRLVGGAPRLEDARDKSTADSILRLAHLRSDRDLVACMDGAMRIHDDGERMRATKIYTDGQRLGAGTLHGDGAARRSCGRSQPGCRVGDGPR